jgi:transcriptional regulator with XRE-family HTH domain
VATRETRTQRGLRLAKGVRVRLLGEIRHARVAANVSQRKLATALGWSHSRYRRFEANLLAALDISDISLVASHLGLELSASLFPVGDALLDKGHQALIKRIRHLLSPLARVIAEAPVAIATADRRAWDLVVGIAAQLVGIEAETRVRDVQAFVRRIRMRERDGSADVIVIVLSDSRANRFLVDELREALGPAYATPPRNILAALRAGQPVPGSGVLLV